MRLISQFGMALLLLNLSLGGRELACAHDAHASGQPPAAAGHGGMQAHHDPAPAESDSPPCDESSKQCCDALAPCTVAGVPERASGETALPSVDLVLIAGSDAHLSSAPLEVATPPPRA